MELIKPFLLGSGAALQFDHQRLFLQHPDFQIGDLSFQAINFCLIG